MKKNFTHQKRDTLKNLKNSTSAIPSSDIKLISQSKFNLKLQSIIMSRSEVCPAIDTYLTLVFFYNHEMKLLFTAGRMISLK